ncbi:putative cytochrome P450 [Helianthus annuus]|nr:putative cytochrome P450 [Helianthus annuus]
MEIFTIFPSWLLTTALVFFMFFTFLYTLRSNSSSITAPKLPPNPPKLPIIGNLHNLIGKPRHEALWQLSKEYGPVMLFHIGSKPYLIISSPAMAKQVLKTHDHIFCSRPLSKGVKRLTYNYLDIAFSLQAITEGRCARFWCLSSLVPKELDCLIICWCPRLKPWFVQ